MSPEDAQKLMNVAQGIDAQTGQEEAMAGQTGPAGAMVAAQGPNPAMEWLFVPELLATVITTALPETTPCYTAEGNLSFAEKLAAVAEKRGWNVSSAPEIALAIAALGFAAPAFMVLKMRKEAALAAQNDRAGQGGAPLGSGGTHGG